MISSSDDGLSVTLCYAYDPMCSWCYAFDPVWKNLHKKFKKTLIIETLLGGLAPDSNFVMPADMQARISNTWSRIEHAVPGTKFNYDFWKLCIPRRSTYPACRAVIAASEQGKSYEFLMVDAIQRAYYREARNPSLMKTLMCIAEEIGLDVDRFTEVLMSEECNVILQKEINKTIALGIRGFPTLLLLHRDQVIRIEHDFSSAEITANRVEVGVRQLKV
ncbi:MAG: hypothetical protein CMM56_01490 [Rhodospirillaceae bacterium]|nr:hypothetical protein [Rhodospirillaceae bacterium]|tara:strand:+ start:297 stop:953 length:657 start_codon:yes stop_codon:yes gene_type:complete